MNWGEGSDTWVHGAIPTNGMLSLNRDGSTATNSPQNFAGQRGTIGGTVSLEETTYQGLWWAFPAGSESGWGVNITHQANTIFATWFTYDTDGSPMWLVMDNGARRSETSEDPYGYGSTMMLTDKYGGPLYRTNGPAFSSVPFDPTRVGVTEVGTALFDYTDPNIASFTYTVNGVTQTKLITRQVYGATMPQCHAGGAAGAQPNYQALWWRSPGGSESGWGVNITHQGDTLFATWFTYAADGKGMWLVMSNGEKTGASTYSGPFYRTRGPAFNVAKWNSSTVSVTPAGTGTFTFTDANNGTFAYTVDGITQSKPITRQVYANPASVCRNP